jgi:transposase InsO family protein
MVEGRKFTIYTDHKPLTFALKRTTDPWTARQCRQLAFVAEYTSDLRHLAGKENVVADALSRPPGHAVGASPSAAAGIKAPPGSPVAARRGDKPTSSASAAVMAVAAADHAPQAGVDYFKMAAAQQQCEESLQLAASSSLQVQRRRVRGMELLCDVSTAVVRPIVPAACRREVFTAMHYLAHPGIRATRRMVTRRFIWKGCGADIARWCRDCQDCQRGKITRQPAAAVQPIPVPHRRFSHLHADLVGPLPTSPEGFKYIFTVIDRSTRWLEAIPVKNLEATTAVDALVEGWISRFGVPTDITTDRGTQFTSQVWEKFCTRLGVQHHMTTAYHPASNGLVERAHRQLKDSLRTRLAGNDWPAHLPWILMGLRAAPKEDSGVSSAELVLGSPLTLPGEFLHGEEPPAENFLQYMRDFPPLPLPTRPLTGSDTVNRIPEALMNAKFVYVRRGGQTPPLAPLYSGPYEVLEAGRKVFKISVGGKTEMFTVDRLKPHLGTAPLQAATPPVRGRPAKRAASGVAAPSGVGSEGGRVETENM